MAAIPLNALRTFEAVASRLSFAKGAQALNVTPAAVSSQIRALEQRLNQPLFRRHGRRVELTGAGQRLLPGVQAGLAELTQAVERVSQDSREGVLNITTMPSFLQKFLMPRLHEFHNAHQHINLRVNVDNELVDFDQSDMHAGVRMGQGKWQGTKSVHLMDDWIVPVCSRRFLKKNGPLDSAEALMQHPLLFTPSALWDPWFREFGEHHRDRRWAVLNDSISILMAAEQGEGIALSRWSLVAREIKARRLVRPLNTVIKSEWSHYFSAPPHYFDLPKVVLFRDWLQERCNRFEPPD